MKRDYYEILGIAKDANLDEIKKSYRRMALRYHPDRVSSSEKKEAEEKFKEISEAYEVLGDSNKRATYDQFGHEGLKGVFARDGFNWQDFTHFGDFEDIFSGSMADFLKGFGVDMDIFDPRWTRQRSRGPRRGRDVQYELEMDFIEAALGAEKTIEVYRHEVCSVCRASGAKPGTKDTACPVCNGRGQVSMVSGFFSISRTCHECGGIGRVIKSPCQKCDGKGHVRTPQKIKVKIPRGVDSGIRLRVSHEGDAGERGGPRGDLYVVIYVKEHPIFKRDNNDIYCEIKISFTQAVFGSEVEVPTVDGKVKMKIPQGTPSGKIFRLRGRGVPNIFSNSEKGDQLVRISVDVPQRLTDEQKRLLKEFAQTLGEKVYPKGFMEQVKKAFK